MTSPTFAYPPFRMKRAEAARYCGMSDSAFLRSVERGRMPEGKQDDGGVYWLRIDLEAAMLDELEIRAEPAEDSPRHDFRKAI